MSETVHYRGKLKVVERLENETLEDQCKRLLGDKLLDSYYKSYREMLEDEFYKEYVIHNDILYSIVNKQDIDPDYDMFHAEKNEDGTINFEVKYYNGGCSFSEAIEEALDKLDG